MDNRVAQVKDKDKKIKSKIEREMDLKRRNQELNDKYRDLHEKTDKPEDVDFTDHRVYELWALAKRANMSEVELAEFKVLKSQALDIVSCFPLLVCLY